VVSSERALLESAGHSVRLFEAINPDDRMAAAARLLSSPWNLAAAARLRAVVKTAMPAVAHLHNTWFSISPAAISELRRLSVPTVMTVHNYRLTCLNAQLLRDGAPCELCVGTHPWRGVQYRCYRDSVFASTMAATTLVLHRALGTWTRQVGVFLVLNSFIAQIMERVGLPADRTLVVPNFVGDPGLRPMSPSESDTVLFVGRLSGEKGVDLLVGAWRRVRPSGLRLLVVGEGPLRADLERHGSQGVSFLGQVAPADVRRLMLSARALVFPSVWYEGQPLVLLEALAAGLPILAHDTGGVIETAGDGAHRVESWEESLTEILRIETTLDDLGRKARARWADRFTPRAHLTKLLDAYRQAASFSQANG
jgi:glycosyltransferase involved in cell wall biosynthesis